MDTPERSCITRSQTCARERSVHCPLAQRKAGEGRLAGRRASGEEGFPVWLCVPLSFGDSTGVFFMNCFL